MTFFGMYLIYLALGIVVAAAFLLWALWNNQFRDQQRARYLPLGELEPLPAQPRQRWSRQITLTVILGSLGLITLLVTIVLLFVRSAGGGA